MRSSVEACPPRASSSRWSPDGFRPRRSSWARARLATGAPLSLLAVWRWWEPVELAMIAGEHSLREEAHDVPPSSATACAAAATTSTERLAPPPPSAARSTTPPPRTPRAPVLGPAHRGPTGRVLAGSTASNFLHGAPCPVAIPPRDYCRASPAGRGASASPTPIATRAARPCAAQRRSRAAPARRSASSPSPTRGSRPSWCSRRGFGAADVLAERRAATRAPSRRRSQRSGRPHRRGRRARGRAGRRARPRR